MARCGPRTSKSRGRSELCIASLRLCPLRLPPAAPLFCSNLRCLLDGVFHTDGPRVLALRRALGSPMVQMSPQTCRACRLAPPAFVRAVSYGPYEGRMRDAIHALKYDGLQRAARRLGGMLATAIGRLAAEAPAEMLVIPVPLHRSKYSQRGFNQARAPGGECAGGAYAGRIPTGGLRWPRAQWCGFVPPRARPV